MNGNRKLALKKEVLNELTSDDLSKVVGGSHYCETNPPNFCLSIRECVVTHEAACAAPTQFQSCAC